MRRKRWIFLFVFIDREEWVTISGRSIRDARRKIPADMMLRARRIVAYELVGHSEIIKSTS